MTTEPVAVCYSECAILNILRISNNNNSNNNSKMIVMRMKMTMMILRPTD